MIDAPSAATDQQQPAPWEKARLLAVCCAECGFPVSHFDPRVTGAKAGGMCTRATCVTDRKTGKKRAVYTYAVVREV